MSLAISGFFLTENTKPNREKKEMHFLVLIALCSLTLIPLSVYADEAECVQARVEGNRIRERAKEEAHNTWSWFDYWKRKTQWELGDVLQRLKSVKEECERAADDHKRGCTEGSRVEFQECKEKWDNIRSACTTLYNRVKLQMEIGLTASRGITKGEVAASRKATIDKGEEVASSIEKAACGAARTPQPKAPIPLVKGTRLAQSGAQKDVQTRMVSLSMRVFLLLVFSLPRGQF